MRATLARRPCRHAYGGGDLLAMRIGSERVLQQEGRIRLVVVADAIRDADRGPVPLPDLGREQGRANAGDDRHRAGDRRVVFLVREDEDHRDQRDDRRGEREQQLGNPPLVLAPAGVVVLAKQLVDRGG